MNVPKISANLNQDAKKLNDVILLGKENPEKIIKKTKIEKVEKIEKKDKMNVSPKKKTRGCC